MAIANAASAAQAIADPVDPLNVARLFVADFLHAEGIDLRQVYVVLSEMMHPSIAITDCESLYGTLENSELLTM